MSAKKRYTLKRPKRDSGNEWFEGAEASGEGSVSMEGLPENAASPSSNDVPAQAMPTRQPSFADRRIGRMGIIAMEILSPPRSKNPWRPRG